MRLHRLQIIKRRRPLDDEEKDILLEIRKKNQSIRIRCAANILLEKNDSAQDCFDEMEDEDTMEFIDYPICNLGRIEYHNL